MEKVLSTAIVTTETQRAIVFVSSHRTSSPIVALVDALRHLGVDMDLLSPDIAHFVSTAFVIEERLLDDVLAVAADYPELQISTDSNAALVKLRGAPVANAELMARLFAALGRVGVVIKLAATDAGQIGLVVAENQASVAAMVVRGVAADVKPKGKPHLRRGA